MGKVVGERKDKRRLYAKSHVAQSPVVVLSAKPSVEEAENRTTITRLSGGRNGCNNAVWKTLGQGMRVKIANR